MSGDKDLFDASGMLNTLAPLAERMRPRSLDEVVGQTQLLAPESLLRQAVESGNLPSIIFWGPPGCGKTTLARILAEGTGAAFVSFSAVLSGVAEVRKVISEARDRGRMTGQRTVLFVDEIHRFNKAQQDSFLPHVESGVIVLIGATTENPSFEVISALRSRCRVMTLEPLEAEQIQLLVQRALGDSKHGFGALKIAAEPEALRMIAEASHGDARVALNALEVVASSKLPLRDGSPLIDVKAAAAALAGEGARRYDKSGDEHYNVISAFIKSMRGSDPDAALYYLARMIDAGEDPLFIARRLLIFASEDVGLADPYALPIANAVAQAVHMLGMPEGRIPLAHATVHLACAPKSNSAYAGLNSALADVGQHGALEVPLHLRNAPTSLMKELGYHDGYRYAHDFDGGQVEQQHLPERLKNKRYFRPKEIGYERRIKERLEEWSKQRQRPKKDEPNK
ncbi:MAG: replication-associated recombination protein A [Candidatus Alcyoniella australis]|nr:replication-associated recombination protein A [Candidatus Alcyoniella australis]